MARGCDEFTVQQLLNFLYEQEQKLLEQNEAAHAEIGKALMAESQVWVDRASAEYRNRRKLASDLEEFRHEVERKCGELWDHSQAEARGE